MKPFNLQEALAGKKVVDKYERIGYYVGMIDNQYPYVFAFDNLEPTQQFVALFNEHGQCVANPRYDTLSMATEKKTVWVNVYRTSDGLTLHHGGTLHSTKELAEAMGQYGAYKLAEAMGQYGAYKSIGTYPIEIEV